MTSLARNGDIEIAYDVTGAGDPLLLVMGQGGSMRGWHPDFVRMLVDRGFMVIRYDNRDTGGSTRFRQRPGQLEMLLNPAAAAAYTLEDMADDALAVLDAVGCQSTHVAGVSMGGMIAQTLAIRCPQRIRTLTSISSTPAPRLGQPAMSTLLRIAKVMKGKDAVGRQVQLHRITGSPGYPADLEFLRALAAEPADLAAIQRHTAAIAASGDRREQLSQVRVPALVIHGEADPVIRLAAGIATAEAIRGARLMTCPGMGHDLPRELWPAIVDAIGQHMAGDM
jgi:pimeloyl-ACP methyl ester carboxylesterase